MNPFPDTIISPTTANRIPRSPGAEGLIDELRGHDINAAAFLMDADLLDAAEGNGFHNDLDRALADLLGQAQPHVLDAIFPPPPEPVTMATSIPDATGSSEGGGSMREGLGISRSHRRDERHRGHSMGF